MIDSVVTTWGQNQLAICRGAVFKYLAEAIGRGTLAVIGPERLDDEECARKGQAVTYQRHVPKYLRSALAPPSHPARAPASQLASPRCARVGMGATTLRPRQSDRNPSE